MHTIVLKFGGAAVASIAQIDAIAGLVIAEKNRSKNIIVVVSAMGGTTDQLIALARSIHPSPPSREYDMLISVGERISMSLLAMALCRRGHEAVSLTGSQSGIITSQEHAEARIVDVRPKRIESLLALGKIVIVAGFQGVSREGEITTLGRGGSDTTAVSLGIALNSEKVVFYKDVSGVFSCDPKINKEATCYAHMNYEEALEIVEKGAKILHRRALVLAALNGLPLQVRSFLKKDEESKGTLIFCERKKRSASALYEESA